MKTRSILVVSAMLIGILAGGITSNLLARSGRPVQTVATQLAQPVAGSTGQTWEYRIISGLNTPGDPGKSLERSINEVAAQGFEVQALQSTESAVPGTQNPNVIVLLRRPKK